MNILLLNPPGLHSFSRDYFCSKVTKTGYIEHPVDLLLLSGILSEKHQVSFIDSILDNSTPCELKRQISGDNFDAIIFLSGTSSFPDDSRFLKNLKCHSPNLILVGIGDVFRDEKVFRSNEWLDAVILDFTNRDIMAFLENDFDSIKNMFFRGNGTIFVRKTAIPKHSVFEIPVPRHDLFINSRYLFPFSRFHPYATVLTDFGCPFNCAFCIYCTLGFKLRPIENVVEELRFLKSLKIREIFFKDQAFGADKNRTFELCKTMTEIGGFSWSCFMRADCISPDLLKAMKIAGCHTIMFGVESANEAILERFHKNITKEKVRYAFSCCKDEKIDRLGIFILGFPDESEKSVRQTIKFAFELDCDFVSFNVFMPKPETPARKWIEKQLPDLGWENETLDQSGFLPFKSYSKVSSSCLETLKNWAILRFYFRPTYFLRRIRKAQTSFELKMLFMMGFSMFFSILEQVVQKITVSCNIPQLDAFRKNLKP
ncbi:MAG: radical SAM protein [Candidatus Riflebacteria bacterium]|nr:radical SAM protein [Candidatus Riflebacteria bacterium]